MPELNFRIDGKGATSGAKRVNTALDSISSKSKSLISSALNPLTLAIGGFASFQTITGLGTIADSYTTMAAQLKYVTGTTQDAEQAQKELYAMSQKTGTSMKDNSAALVRLSQASEMTNLSTTESIDIIGGLNALMLKTGTSGAAASASMLQLTQALASGTLQGDEFRSIMENSPALMRAFAQSMGVGVGELKKMASEGKITTDVMIAALKGISAEAQSSFDELPATASSGWQRVVNAFEKAWDKINDDTGIMGKVFDAMLNLATWIEDNSPRFSAWADVLVKKLTENWPFIKEVFDKLLDSFITVFNVVYDNWDSITGFFSDVVDTGIWMYDTLKPIFGWLLDTFEAIGALKDKTLAGANTIGGVPANTGFDFAGGDFGTDALKQSFFGSGATSSTGGSTSTSTTNNYFNQSLSRNDVVTITTEQERIGGRL